DRLESEDVRNEADGAVMSNLGKTTSSIRTKAGTTDANTLVTDITGIKLILPTATALKSINYTDADRAKAVVEIDDVDITKATGVVGFETNKYGEGANEKKVFEDLEKLLTDIFIKYEDNSVSNLPDAPAITTDLAKLTPYLSNGTGGADVASYTHNNTGNITEPNAKKILRLLDEFQIPGKTTFGGGEAGYETIEEIVKANANGYVISNRGQNANPGATGTHALIGLAGQKGQIVEGYKIDNDSVLDGVGGYTTNANNIKYVKKVLSVAKVFGVAIGGDQITPANTNALDVRLNDKEFNASTTIKYSTKQGDTLDYENMPVNDFADVHKTRGLRPSDLIEASGNYLNRHGEDLSYHFGAYDGATISTKTDEAPTKLCFDLLGSKNADVAIDLAFFGKHFYKKDDDTYRAWDSFATTTPTGDPERTKAKAAYDLSKTFLDEWKNYSKKSYSGKDKDNDKKELADDKKAKKKIDTSGGKVTEADIDTARDAVVAASKNGTDFKNKLKSIFDDNRADLKNNNKTVLNHLRALAELIDKAYKNGDDVKRSALEAYSKDTGDKKKVWDMANKVKTEDNKNLADEALKKAKGVDSNAELETAKTNAKITLNGKVDKAGEAESKGFAKGALKHLEKFTEGRQKEVEDSGILTADTPEAVREARKKIKGTDNETVNKVIPRVDLLEDLYGKDDKAKKLAKLIRDNFLKKLESDYSDSDYKNNLDNLNKQLTDLRKYKDGENKSVYEGLEQTKKATFDKLINDLESKVNAMKVAKQKTEGGNQTKDPQKPFFKTPLGIILICVGVAAVLGAIAYAIKANSRTEGE
ncbi:8821_t:CDS:2, partial [Racocetra persica]